MFLKKNGGNRKEVVVNVRYNVWENHIFGSVDLKKKKDLTTNYFKVLTNND